MQYLLIICLSLVSMLHDIHISKTDVHYKSEQSSLQITAHIYLDDLEEDMRRKYGFKDLKLCTKYESMQGDSAVVKYVTDHLKISNDSIPLQLNYIGKEISEDYKAAWIYFETPIDEPKALKIEDTILLDLYDDQKNIVMVKKDFNKVSVSILDEETKSMTAKF